MNYDFFLSEHRKPVGRLYRGFDRKEYLEQFIEGQIRLGYYRYYRDIPEFQTISGIEKNLRDPRFNRDEGIIRGIKMRQADGSIKTYTTFGLASPHYISCWATDKKSVVGKYIVQLNEPLELHKRILAFLGYSKRHYSGHMVNPREIVFEERRGDTNLITHYADIHESKNEYRFSYWIMKDESTGNLYIPTYEEDSSFAKPKGEVISSYDSNKAIKRDQYHPHFYTLRSVRVNDIVVIL